MTVENQPFEHVSPTPWKTNMSPEIQWLEDVFPIENGPFLGDMLVFGGVLKRQIFRCHVSVFRGVNFGKFDQKLFSYCWSMGFSGTPNNGTPLW